MFYSLRWPPYLLGRSQPPSPPFLPSTGRFRHWKMFCNLLALYLLRPTSTRNQRSMKLIYSLTCSGRCLINQAIFQYEFVCVWAAGNEERKTSNWFGNGLRFFSSELNMAPPDPNKRILKAISLFCGACMYILGLSHSSAHAFTCPPMIISLTWSFVVWN